MTPDDLVLMPSHMRFRGRRFPFAKGRGGLTRAKQEGDGATPQGIHRIVGMLYRPDRLAPPASWAAPIGPSDLWSDDMNDMHYNNMVKAPYAHSHENLRRSDPLYDLVLITDWNWPNATPGRGSAIFLHQWRRPHYPTEGCVAFRRDHLLWIAQRIQPGTRLVIR